MKPQDIYILVGCEESQAVTKAFRALGFQAFSCDILPCSGNHPEWHIQGDIFEAIKIRAWDFIISFQPCTHLAVSGAKHFDKKRADGRQEEGIRFFFEVWKHSDCSENPIGILNGGEYIKKWFPALHKEMTEAGFPFRPAQIIQPWQFGDTAQKSTCLWLKNLPLLTHTHRLLRKEIFTYRHRARNYQPGTAMQLVKTARNYLTTVTRLRKSAARLSPVLLKLWPISGVIIY